ncbi:MAG TPA: phosphohydrolase [Clostridiales bacterium]|nr:phosphohydrolase [Clostridiales bacterium]
MALTAQEEAYFQAVAGELLKSPSVQKMTKFTQHGSISTLEHSVSVAYYSYLICKRLHIRADYRSLIRGALLHDFFLYDWHCGSGNEGLHAFSHPKTALRNAEQQFTLSEKERDIIVKHMWPLTITLPRYRESVIVSCSDKFCSVIETLRLYPKYIPGSSGRFSYKKL